MELHQTERAYWLRLVKESTEFLIQIKKVRKYRHEKKMEDRGQKHLLAEMARRKVLSIHWERK